MQRNSPNVSVINTQFAPGSQFQSVFSSLRDPDPLIHVAPGLAPSSPSLAIKNILRTQMREKDIKRQRSIIIEAL